MMRDALIYLAAAVVMVPLAKNWVWARCSVT